jgi:hypothetical protein
VPLLCHHPRLHVIMKRRQTCMHSPYALAAGEGIPTYHPTRSTSSPPEPRGLSSLAQLRGNPMSNNDGPFNCPCARPRQKPPSSAGLTTSYGCPCLAVARLPDRKAERGSEGGRTRRGLDIGRGR